MGFNCGIIGLPNVGKSTIFNALTAAQAEAANYPFCTIEPNKGIVPVPDERLEILAKIAGSATIIPAAVEFLDIAGLVKGASEGEGLGNQFLGHIRSVDALIHVVRCFEDENIVHVDGSISPKRDVEVIETELMLSDLASVEKRLERMAKTIKTGTKEAKEEYAALEFANECLSKGLLLRNIKHEEFDINSLGLLTSKPLLYVANVLEDDVALVPDLNAKGFLGELVKHAHSVKSDVVVISGKVESEVSQLPIEERGAFLEALGLHNSGLSRLAQAGYKLLDLITFFTIGPKEAHAWTCKNGSTSVDAAGKIHTDFAKGFIRAEVIGYADYVQYNGEQGAKEKGLLRVEGKQYLMIDGDIVHFRFNV
ncbi:MAG: redox-regulated ATPase YchF [Proteobacteria bacterium]|nr:redox-regulated ATPase YchF [Pseudomonadota bacterium]